jgi:hypothetical protein
MSANALPQSRDALQQQQQQTKPAKVEPQETPAQRQAAAKQALRKQLEKTLLQVSYFANLSDYTSACVKTVLLRGSRAF